MRFFNDDRALWRISVPEFAPALSLDGDWLLDWAGAQRYLKTHVPAEQIFSAAQQVAGHASCYSADKMANDVPAFQPLQGAVRTLHRRVRDSFDEQRLFNPGRYHAELDAEPANGELQAS